jgi:hypothetical protein
MKNSGTTVILILILLTSLNSSHAANNTTADNKDTILVGIEYFNGWWPRTPNNDIHCFWESNNKDWRSDYPDRIPLLGEYNCQETMDKEILAAAEYGVDFFSILWYYMEHANAGKISDYLNAGVGNFMNSPNSNKMKFMVEIANHDPNAIATDADWDKCIDLCIKSMKHPSYLRIDGRAVVKIHGGDQFYRDNGFSVERSKQVLQHFRKRAKDEGAGEILITVGNYSVKPVDSQHKFSMIGEIDGTMQYNSLPDVPKKESDYPYEYMTKEAKRIREIRKDDILCWAPYFPAGWNPKPWNDKRASFSLPTREQWRNGLEELKIDILKYSNFGFPRKDGSTQKAFTIYAWNEFGEGGIVAPTKGEQYMKLEEIKRVFGN